MNYEPLLASFEDTALEIISENGERFVTVRDLAAARMQTSGFAGRLVVMGDPEIVPGDARIEWADGGIVRDVLYGALSRRKRKSLHRRYAEQLEKRFEGRRPQSRYRLTKAGRAALLGHVAALQALLEQDGR